MKNDKQRFGEDLANKVVDYLKEHLLIRYDHYGYCGTGFVLLDKKILYTHFDEWNSYQHGEIYKAGGDYIGIIKTFSSEEEFVNWLAKQSDESLSGKESGDSWYTDNQRITWKRLEYLLNDKNIDG